MKTEFYAQPETMKKAIDALQKSNETLPLYYSRLPEAKKCTVSLGDLIEDNNRCIIAIHNLLTRIR